MDVRLVQEGASWIVEPTGDEGFGRELEPFRSALRTRADLLAEDGRLQGVAMESLALRAEQDPDRATALRAESLTRAEAMRRMQAQADAERISANSDRLEVETTPDLPTLMIRVSGGVLRASRVSDRRVVATAMEEPDRAGVIAASDWQTISVVEPETRRRLSDRQVSWLEGIRDAGQVETTFNWRLFRAGDSREPELAGIFGALVGSAWMMLVAVLVAFPFGVMASLYLEEFAPRNRFTDIVEVNINNLGAVPSIVFGLLGLAVFLQFFALPRSAPVVGGLTLALMILPIIIIAARASIRSVPPSIRDAAFGVGATRVQTAFHHVLPAAMPGIVTGTVLGVARALGETAPLLLIGMLAFVSGVPDGPLNPATALPALIFQWSEFPETAFQHRAAAAILILVAILAVLIAFADWIRRRFEKEW